MAVDVERLILAIEQQPALYNTRLKECADKNFRKTLCLEVCEELIANWKELGRKEKNEKGEWLFVLKKM